MQPDPFVQQHSDAALAPEDLARRLRWRARRGLLENDLVIERFFLQFGESLSMDDHDGLAALLDLSDNDLMTLLLGREEPMGDLDRPQVHGVLLKLRAA
ncbi:MAG: hypothetical protein RLZZ290_1862 [Pseudomonadota bacterium]|jgi:antitoxin CptB